MNDSTVTSSPHSPTTIRLFGLVRDSIVDGPGFRTAIFVQGCPYHCEGCHNPGSWDPAGGTEWALSDVKAAFLGNPLSSGITLSGGEPAEQAAPCAELARCAREHGLNVWMYSGTTFEKLYERSRTDAALDALLHQVNVLVDGSFVLAQRSLELQFRGSRNQRLIDVPRSLQAGQAVEYHLPEW